MINIICLIAVTVMAPLTNKISVPVITNTQVKGHILQEDEEMYLVDFSQEAKKKKYIGDYKEHMVHKSMCVKLK